MIGLAHRMISSAAVDGRRSRYSRHCAGLSAKASTPCVIALREVSLPATIN
ncbi:Uncharacterised protein [Mycobacteroides abscessus subsp. abscessus]|nr:Uncharacterised protein [Mycobacteroides abscessus subsp. abscessus]